MNFALLADANYQNGKPFGSEEKLLAAFGALCGQAILEAREIGGGRNSRVFSLTSVDGGRYAGKLYFEDGRGRLKREYDGLSFLWESGVRFIPQPLGRDEECSCALFTFVTGRKLASSEVTGREILAAADFLQQLHAIFLSAKAGAVSPASEACFALDAIEDAIARRFGRLLAVGEETAIYNDLRRFLKNDFFETLSKVRGWSAAYCALEDIALNAPLPHSKRTLSPSDFGFHNALLTPEGSLCFLDFEYFGVDDPAKMISDFLLHPGMSVALENKKKFAEEMFSYFDAFEQHRFIRQRTSALYPFFGLNWCLIMLNEFLNSELERRQFADNDLVGNVAQRQSVQLEKAKNMLQKVVEEYEQFPFTH